jgi:uncharacterized protein YjbI with pentapeptide repeats
MLTKNLTSFLYGTKVTSLRPPAPMMTIVVRATYAVADDGTLTVVDDPTKLRPLCGGTYRDDDDEMIGGCLTPSDFADFKPRAEVLLRGSCHPPKRGMRECGVMVKVGTWSKALRVMGRQVWGAAQPNEIETMPLDWENAYGGFNYPNNPVGRGFETNEMPTVAHARDVLRRGDPLASASFLPVNPRWPERAVKRGQEYGREYVATRAPFYPVDFDWTFFLEALPDQWLPGYLKGDEEVVFHNLHPRTAILGTKLPGVRVRTFARDDARTFREAPMFLDTLFADLDAARIELTWRGLLDVREEDLDDVQTLVIAAEPMAGEGANLPVAHYEAIATAFEEDPTGLKKLMPPALGAPLDQPADELAPVGPMLQDTLGALQPEAMKEIVPVVDAAIAEAKARLARAKEERPEVARALAERKPPKPEAPAARTAKPGSAPYVGLRRRMRETVDRAKAARAEAIAKGMKPEHLQRLDEIEALAHDPALKQVDPSYTPPEPLSSDEPGPKANLLDRDLRGADLRGADLREANLEGALLDEANLEGALLHGARLYGATLYKAVLHNADLSGADLSRANVAFARARGARFDRAMLDETWFEDADLEGASFHGAEGEYTIFTRARLARAVLQEVKLRHAELDDAELSGARFVRASIPVGRFQLSRADKADFSGADVSGSSFAKADLSQARFFDTQADGAIFSSTRAHGTVFAFAKLRGCHMDKLVAAGADFYGADLRKARLYRASCDEAVFTSSNLFGADLGKAHLDGAKFTKASLYEAKLERASIKGCDFSGANLKRSTLERS